jgi:DNA-binding transcriptional regulator YiaG
MTIKDICERYGLSQTNMAKRFDIPLRTVQDWHAGRRTPPDYVVSMMVELLELDKKQA